MRPSSAATVAATGFVAVILLLAIATVVTIQRLERVAARNVADIQADEREADLAERLRQEALHVTAIERGYLLTKEPALLDYLRTADGEFDTTLSAMQGHRFQAPDRRLFAEIQRRSTAFRRVQEDVLAAAPALASSELIRRFETQLLPAHNELLAALDSLVRLQQEEIAETYATASAEGDRARNELSVILGLAVLASLGIGWVVTRQLARMSRSEQAALARARDALTAREEVMAIVAHDLRNPLGSIVLKAEVLAKDTPSGPSRRQAASIAAIAMRTEYLVKAMLEVGAIEEHRFELTRASCTPDELVATTVQLFDEAAAAKGIELDVLVRSRDLALDVDKEHVVQALAILVGTAIKFAPPGSKVTIAADAEDNHVRFSVSDHGPGIPSAHLPLLFDRHTRADIRTRDGASLGMFVAKAIVDAHGGRIWAESESGQGATFNLTLPLEDRAVGRPESET